MTKEAIPGGHIWNEGEVTLAQTCTEYGVLHVKCTVCGVEEDQPIEPDGHKMGKKQNQKATCTEEGMDYTECAVCGAREVLKTYKALGHQWNVKKSKTPCVEQGTQNCRRCGNEEKLPLDEHKYRQTVKPTCGQEGLETCTVCKTATRPIAKLEHKKFKTVTNPTCSAEGVEACTSCGAERAIAKLEHDWKEYKATCGDDAYRKCNKCGEIETEPDTATKDHKWKVKTKPTCDTDGLQECTKCKHTDPIPMTGHTWEYTEKNCGKNQHRVCSVCHKDEEQPDTATGLHEWHTVIESTCTATGSKECIGCGQLEPISVRQHKWEAVAPTCVNDGYDRCADCGKTRSNGVKATGEHTWRVTTPSTCIKEGVETCAVCGATRPVALAAHKWVKTIAICGVNGSQTCSVCGEYEEFKGSATNRHDWIKTPATCVTDEHWACKKCGEEQDNEGTKTGVHLYEVTKEATCTSEGSEKCTMCGKTQPIEKLPHQWERQPETCKEDTYDLCKDCGTKGQTYAGTKSDDHSYQRVKEPSCTEPGKEICSVCGDEREIDMKDHEYGEQIGPTCTDLGYRYCKYCGDPYFVADALGHDIIEFGESIEPGCLTAGQKPGKKCSRCDYVELQIETIPANGHTAGDPVTVDPAGGEDGYILTRCAVCGTEISRDYENGRKWIAAEHVTLPVVCDGQTIDYELTLDGTTLTCTTSIGTNVTVTLTKEMIEQLKGYGVSEVEVLNSTVNGTLKLDQLTSDLINQIISDLNGYTGFSFTQNESGVSVVLQGTCGDMLITAYLQ